MLHHKNIVVRWTEAKAAYAADSHWDITIGDLEKRVGVLREVTTEQLRLKAEERLLRSQG